MQLSPVDLRLLPVDLLCAGLELTLLVHERIDVQHKVVEDKIALPINIFFGFHKAKCLWRIHSSQARAKLHQRAAEDRGLLELGFSDGIDLASFRGGCGKQRNRSQGCGEPCGPRRSRKQSKTGHGKVEQ